MTIVCSGCGRDITYTFNSEDYRIALMNEEIPLEPGRTTVTDMMIPRKIDKDHHFCSFGCLKNFVNGVERGGTPKNHKPISLQELDI